MTGIRALTLALAASVCLATAASAQVATPPSSEYKPTSGQAGKDVVWVPSPQALVEKMLDMAGVTKNDRLVDLGSGDGRTVITAAKRGVPARGIEYNPDMVTLAKRAAAAEGVAERATFEQADIFVTDFSDATVVTMFLLPELNTRLRPKLLEMKPGTRIVSNTFDMGDWQPDQRVDAGGDCTSWCRASKWIIPAKVAGTWSLGGGELKLSQTYQMLAGEFSQGGKASPISEAKMDGAKIAFTVDGKRYSGEVVDGKMTGQVEGGTAWSAMQATR